MITKLSIGEFSKVTGIPPKTLRFYHEIGLLNPATIDSGNGYRFYDQRCIEKARIITALKSLEFSLDDISRILNHADDDRDILDHLASQQRMIREEIVRRKTIIQQIDHIITMEKESKKMANESPREIHEKEVEALMVAGIRMTGRYSDCGKAFGILGKKVGRHIAGKGMCLYYDGEYRESDADFEPCFPVSKEVEKEGIQVHEISAGKVLSLIHEGPYEDLGNSYAKLFEAARQRDFKVLLPTREIYIKGPGMIFKGKPEKYLTEIQLPVNEGGAPQANS